MRTEKKNIFLSIIYFLLSIVLTWIFISGKYWLYETVTVMMVSGIIAGAVWAIQVIAALIFLEKNKWLFIRHISRTCFAGSCLLFCYNLLFYFSLPLSGYNQLLISIALSVLVMMILYYKSVVTTGISLKWFFGWLGCLATAIFLQLTIVFK